VTSNSAISILGKPEQHLVERDVNIAKLIASQSVRWPQLPTEYPIWGLVRIIVAQQVSTRQATRMAQQIAEAFPHLVRKTVDPLPDLTYLRRLGIPERRARCCIEVLRKESEIMAAINSGLAWDEALAGIKGIGPWTLAIFRIMVLRHPDVLPKGDVGLDRAIKNVYGEFVDPSVVGEAWSPFRSVACWYLWKTLGNEQLG
jgi:DNA-3-methyladenine glycosylase II